MADQHATDDALDPVETAAAMTRLAERSQKIVREFLERQAKVGTNPDPLNIGGAFLEMTAKMMSDPQKLVEAQAQLWQSYMGLWQATARRMLGEEEVAPVAQPEPGDRRFKDEAWSENAVFDFIKQSYLLSARWMHDQVTHVEGLDEKTARKVDFYTRQFVDAMAPSNFVLTNPTVLRETLDSKGENLIHGLENLIEDLERGHGQLNVKMTDTEAFEVGGNIAVTPGKVVYQNELMQLIQYTPRTETVHKRPLVIVPPWINKYYILDLKPENSFVKWAVEQGHTVFVVSWVNPDERLAQKTFEDYMMQGPLAALDAIEQATGEREVNAIGYCLGGTLLAATLAWMAAKGDDRVKSATYFATLVDFEEVGELSVFIDEEQIAWLEEKMAERGYLPGEDMATTFNMLRSNDLIWSFVVNNYLMGKDPFPFDLLYWNSDATRMPAAMHSFYLRKMYQENKLSQPGGITLKGVPIDLGAVKTPSFILASKEDHIAPWVSAYKATHLYGGPTKFVLAASGHIAGVINPPAADKYCHWLNSRKPKNPETWFKNAQQHDGSWWPEWDKWISRFTGPEVPARQPGDGKLKPIEDAPGSYVKVRSQE